jgi:hypothetical protein
VLDDGAKKLALVVCDLLGVHRLVSDEARRQIEKECGIPPANVLISATHTHSASSALGTDRLRYEQTLDDYQKFVAQRIADGVRRAMNNLRPAEFAYGSIDVPEHLNNRRWFMRPGTVPENPFGGFDLVKMNPPAGSPNLTEPAGPIDPEVSLLSFREPDGGRPIAVYAAYSLHYVGGVGAHAISADYFAVFADELARKVKGDKLDPPFVGLMANATSGDINNNNFRNARGRKAPYEQMAYVAGDLAEKVSAALPSLSYHRDVTLDARFREVTLGWRRPTPQEKAWAEKTLAERAPTAKPGDLPTAYAGRVLKLAEYPETGELPVQALRIGDVVIGTLPCEVFAEIGIEFKRRSPLKPAFMVELAHGYYGYLPTPRHFEFGGYETWIGTNRLEPQASVKLLDALLEMVGELKSAENKP